MTPRSAIHKNPPEDVCEAEDCGEEAEYYVEREGSADLCGPHASDVKNGYATIDELNGSE